MAPSIGCISSGNLLGGTLQYNVSTMSSTLTVPGRVCIWKREANAAPLHIMKTCNRNQGLTFCLYHHIQSVHSWTGAGYWRSNPKRSKITIEITFLAIGTIGRSHSKIGIFLPVPFFKKQNRSPIAIFPRWQDFRQQKLFFKNFSWASLSFLRWNSHFRKVLKLLLFSNNCN